MYLSGQAEFDPRARSIQVSLFVGDDEALHPEVVQKGVCTLKKGSLVVDSVSFDAACGNSDGGFYPVFHRVCLSDYTGLTVEVRINEGEFTLTLTPAVAERDCFEKTLPKVEEVSSRLEL